MGEQGYSGFFAVPRELADDAQIDLDDYLRHRVLTQAERTLTPDSKIRLRFIGTPEMQVREITEDDLCLPAESMSAFWREITHCRLFHVKLVGELEQVPANA